MTDLPAVAAETESSEPHVVKIAAELTLCATQVRATAALLAEGATVPFIARYRKEVTGSLDEVQVTSIRDRLAQLEELHRRRVAIMKSLQERKLLTTELLGRIGAAETMATLEESTCRSGPTAARGHDRQGKGPGAAGGPPRRAGDRHRSRIQEAARFVTPRGRRWPMS